MDNRNTEVKKRRHELSWVEGSTFWAGGAGVMTQMGTEGEAQVSPEKEGQRWGKGS